MILLKGGRVIDPSNNFDEIADVLIDNNKISQISRNICESTALVYDVSGKIVSPGFVEMHAHMRDLGESDRETMYTGSCGAAVGGFTSVSVMSNTVPPVDTPEIVELVKKRAKESSVVNIFPFACATLGRQGNEVVDMKALKAAGVVAFSDDGNSIKEATVMRELLEKSKEVNLVVDVHCEDKAYTGKGVVNSGKLAEEMGLPGISSVSEDIMIARDLIIQEEIGGNLHIAHLGSERSIELVKMFKGRGVQFTCELIPHQFSMTEEIVKEQGVRAKVKPPFRSQTDVDGIRSGLQQRLIDVIATDHCPYTDLELAGGLTGTNLFGLIGFETTLPLTLDMVHKGIIDYSYALSLLTINPARILRLEKGTLSIGADADITVIDPDIEWVVDVEKLRSKASNCPYGGKKMRGAVHMTIVNGEVVYKDGEILRAVEKPY